MPMNKPILNIRRYLPEDKELVLQLLDLNTPKFFDEAEREDFNHYLEEEIEDYFLVEDANEVLGVGGINYFLEERIARISWDIIKPNAQGKGIGGLLTKHRIRYLNQNNKIDTIVVRTTQLVFKFYEKMGFKLVEIKKDFWADGFDLYQMELDNNPNTSTK